MKPATLGQACNVLDMIREKKIDLDRLQALINKGLLADLIDADPATVDRSKLRKLLGLEPEYEETPAAGVVFTSHLVSVYYDPRVAAKLVQHDFGWLNDYAARSPMPRHGTDEREVVVMYPKVWANTDKVEEMVQEAGLLWADTQEQFAYFDAHPDLRGHFPLVSLGPKCTIHGNEHVVVCYRDHSPVMVTPDYYQNEWGPNCRFLLVKDPTKS